MASWGYSIREIRDALFRAWVSEYVDEKPTTDPFAGFHLGPILYRDSRRECETAEPLARAEDGWILVKHGAPAWLRDYVRTDKRRHVYVQDVMQPGGAADQEWWQKQLRSLSRTSKPERFQEFDQGLKLYRTYCRSTRRPMPKFDQKDRERADARRILLKLTRPEED